MQEWKPPLLKQPDKGYRYGLDPLLLAAFAKPFFADRWCDLGTGCGILAYLIARACPNYTGIALERQPLLYQFAKQNLNHQPVVLAQTDVRRFSFKARSIQLVLTNPPFFASPNGRLSPNAQKAAARFSLHGGIDAFFSAVSLGLENHAVFCYILPTEQARKWQPPSADGWRPLALLNICNSNGATPVRQCWAWQKDAKKCQVRDLVLFDEQQRHSQAFHLFMVEGIGALA